MSLIFFDLETTTLYANGQILNYAFIEVDREWNITDQLCGEIKISSLELPAPQAILKNRIRVNELQNNQKADTETDAMLKIHQWLYTKTSSSPTKIKLAGYNVINFDIPFLRTSMIRNGLNPYFGGRLEYGDVLHLSRKIYTLFGDKAIKQDPTKPATFRLEYVCEQLGLLENRKQTHESYDDVLLTIQLAKLFSEHFNLDLHTYNSYEYSTKQGPVVHTSYIEWNKETNVHQITKVPMVALDHDRTQSLWIDLTKWKDKKGFESIKWYNKNTSQFFVIPMTESELRHHLADAQSARNELQHINTKNYWKPKICDVEEYIYMANFDTINALYDAIWDKNLSTLKKINNKYANTLYLRWVIKNTPVVTDTIYKLMKDYIIYRYGGRMIINRWLTEGATTQPPAIEDHHPTYDMMLAEVVELENTLQGDDRDLMVELKHFYQHSLVHRLLMDDGGGSEL